MIKVQNIGKSFRENFWEKPKVVLNSISFEVNSGDLVGFLGLNGAGKTTLIKIMLNFIKADHGQIKFNLGEDYLKHIGFLPERPYLYQTLTGLEFLRFMGKLSKASNNIIENGIDEWSERLKMNHALEKKVGSYSKGMQQRLGFISCIIHGPKLLILDEPLSGLDPLGRIEFKNILKELHEKNGTTIFFSSHVLSDVEEISNKVLFIEDGNVAYSGGLESLLAQHSSNNYKVKYLREGKIEMGLVSENEIYDFGQMVKLKGGVLHSIEKDRMSLEEIVYHIKKN